MRTSQLCIHACTVQAGSVAWHHSRLELQALCQLSRHGCWPPCLGLLASARCLLAGQSHHGEFVFSREVRSTTTAVNRPRIHTQANTQPTQDAGTASRPEGSQVAAAPAGVPAAAGQRRMRPRARHEQQEASCSSCSSSRTGRSAAARVDRGEAGRGGETARFAGGHRCCREGDRGCLPD